MINQKKIEDDLRAAWTSATHRTISNKLNKNGLKSYSSLETPVEKKKKSTGNLR